MSQRALPVMLLVALGVVAYQQLKLGNFPPPPATFIGVAIVFSLLSVLAVAAPQLAGAFGVAVVIWLVFAYRGALIPKSKQGATA